MEEVEEVDIGEDRNEGEGGGMEGMWLEVENGEVGGGYLGRRGCGQNFYFVPNCNNR